MFVCQASTHTGYYYGPSSHCSTLYQTTAAAQNTISSLHRKVFAPGGCTQMAQGLFVRLLRIASGSTLLQSPPTQDTALIPFTYVTGSAYLGAFGEEPISKACTPSSTNGATQVYQQYSCLKGERDLSQHRKYTIVNIMN